MQRPPSWSAASTNAKRLPAAARRRAAAMPAAPAPTITASTLPERGTSGTGGAEGADEGGPFGRGAVNAGAAARVAEAAEAARKDRRLQGFMVRGCLAYGACSGKLEAGFQTENATPESWRFSTECASARQ